MFNFYLYNNSFSDATATSIESNLQDLNQIVVEEKEIFDSFFKHESIWNVQTAEGPFGEVVFGKMSDKQFSHTVLPKLFQAIKSVEMEINTLEEFDTFFRLYNAFYGLNFEGIDICRCIRNKDQYLKFRNEHLWDVTPESFWERKEHLFQRIRLCPSVERNLNEIGGTYLAQIIVKLKELDTYSVRYWNEGNFDVDDVNNKASLRISYESKATMGIKKLVRQRTFSMPDGSRECFELHIKTGDLRFHFFPKNQIIYIGYIGPHLSTAKGK